MAGTPHGFSRGKGTVPVTGHATYKLTCPECNWSQIIATAGAPSVLQCPLCSWDDIDVRQEGTFVSFECIKHGVVTCIVTTPLAKPLTTWIHSAHTAGFAQANISTSSQHVASDPKPQLCT